MGTKTAFIIFLIHVFLHYTYSFGILYSSESLPELFRTQSARFAAPPKNPQVINASHYIYHARRFIQ